ncbi:MAG: DUF2019 domain-containing protein [Ruminiclostridium sp.]|nr:DUF2019 domain-containing protein [Ruminiclostridium sp.]
MDLIEEYMSIAIELEKLNKSGLSSKKDVKRNNHLADKLRHIAKTIESERPDIKGNFADLIFHANSNVRIWCAHHMLEIMTYQSEQKRNALQEIVACSSDNYGEKLWLKEWYDKHPNDKFLI